MIISVTERATFKRCRRQWYYSSFNLSGLSRLVPKGALGLGTLIHATLADWLVQDIPSLRDRFLERTVEEIDKAKAAYSKQVGTTMSDEELGPLYDIVELGASMMENYQAYWKQPLMDGFTVIQPEQRVSVPIGFMDHRLEARLDGLIKDKHGRIYILEHKTYGNRPNQGSLDTNDQFLAYIWIAQQLGLGPVAGVAYDGLWKRAKPPKGSSMSDLFVRHLLQRPPEELEEFHKYLMAEVAEMSNLSNPDYFTDAYMYLNRRWEGCYDCDFEPLCRATSRGEDSDYIRRTMYTLRQPDEVEVE